MARQSGGKTKPKTELQKKLQSIRKEMNSDNIKEWHDWAVKEKNDLTEVVFNAMTRGERIAKDNIQFAIKLAKQGKKILTAYNARITAEVAGI